MNEKRFIAISLLIAATAPIFLLTSLWYRRSEFQQRLLITLFFTAFGFSFVMGGDMIRHYALVELYFSQLSFAHFLEDLWLILTFQVTEGGANDVYNHVISYFFGGVLNLPQLYIPFVATVYGYFYAGSVVHVLRKFKLARANYVLVGFVIFFLILKGPEGVQTVRTWTGLWVLVYACLKYYETKKIQYLLLMLAPPFIHFGYWLMAIPAWVVLVFGSRPLIYSSLLFASSFTTLIPSDPVLNIVRSTERGASSVQWYEVDEQTDQLLILESRVGQTIWYNAYRQSGLHRWAPILLGLGLFLSGIYAKVMTAYERRIFSVGILMLTFSNATWFLYAVSNRSLTVASIFILAGYLMARFNPQSAAKFRGLSPYYQWSLHLALLLWFPAVLFALSINMDRLSIFSFFLPWLTVVESEFLISVKEFLSLLLGRS